MKLRFLGGAGSVTGSKTLLELEKESYLVDYGLYQGSSESRERNWDNFQNASQITAVFLTHAHIDHSGLLPRLWRDGFRGKIYATKETTKLCEILLRDSAKIHEEDAEYANKKAYSRHKPALPLYTHEEAEQVLKQFHPVSFHEEVEVSESVTITFYWAGHIIGSSFIRVKLQEGNQASKIVTFSGDLGHSRNTLLNPPEALKKTDLLVLESTYGRKLHPRIPVKQVLGMYLKAILSRSGVAVIPSFSVGRTQDVLFLVKQLILEGEIPEVPVFLDSPLSRKANRIFNECLSELSIKKDILEQKDIYPETLQEIDTIQESKSLNSTSGPMIIISASGMIEGGRVVHHVKKRVTDKKNGIILVGFQPEGTKGKLLIDGIKTLRLHKEELPVNADIFYINSLSAHSDYLDTLEWLKSSKVIPNLVILNHGEIQSSKHLKMLIENQLQLKTTVAELNEEFFIDNL